MRGVKRVTRNLRSEWLNRARKTEVQRSIQDLFGEPIALSKSGSRGADSIYIIKNSRDKKIGVLRLLNPYRKLKTTIEGAPYIVLDGDGRIAREVKSYEMGASAGLTPNVLWSEKDALLCEYFSGLKGFELLQSGKLKAVQLMEIGWQTLRSAHSVGFTHMDASIHNILISLDLKTTKLVDFEFGAAEHMGFEDQYLYDFLRYLESFLKFLDKPSRRAIKDYISKTDILESFVVDPLDLNKLEPALSRLSQDQELWSAVQNKIGISI